MVRLIEAAPARLRVLLAFLAETGCRRGEVLNLTWDAIDETNGFASIEPRDGWTAKTNASYRRLPISEGLSKRSATFLAPDPMSFPAKRPASLCETSSGHSRRPSGTRGCSVTASFCGSPLASFGRQTLPGWPNGVCIPEWYRPCWAIHRDRGSPSNIIFKRPTRHYGERLSACRSGPPSRRKIWQYPATRNAKGLAVSG